ncbi:MAG: cysteine--tRNA ligase [Leptospirales bacterium]|nr:cysteine--tRNA ligase [Leptospirales bacterium]
MMAFRVFNSMSGKKEDFKPADPTNVRVYNCGPTVYNYNHIGNFRSYMSIDLLRRSLLFFGYGVEQTTNITDVEDKIIANAAKQGKKIQDFTEPYIKIFLEDISYLGIQEVEHRPRATTSIPAMIDLMKRLEEHGHLYTQDGDVYFRLRSFEDYGKLSHISPEQLKVAAGGRFTADEYSKEDIRDFALWKKQETPDEPAWDSPWGKGRPGWHLECSAMIREIYGEGGVDIHAGGIDLLFPHHENEIAQSCCAYRGENFARYWVHNEHLLVDGKKMSKSVGNYFTLRDFSEKDKLELLIKEGRAPADLLKLHEKQKMQRALRYLLLSTHYRSRLNFTFENLRSSDAAIERIQTCLDKLLLQTPLSDEVKTRFKKGKLETADSIFKETVFAEAMAAFRTALEDDLNIARALAAVFDAVSAVNAGKLTESICKEGVLFFYAVNQIIDVLEFTNPESREVVAQDLGDLESFVVSKIEERLKARAEKNWKRSDEIRDELKAKGILLKDSAQGTTWEKA